MPNQSLADGTVVSVTQSGSAYSADVSFPGYTPDPVTFQCDAAQYATFQHAMANNLKVDVVWDPLTMRPVSITEHP